MIAAQQFREDLFYRLSMIELKAPSLLERDGDLPLLTRHFVARFASQFGKPITGLIYRAQLLLRQHDWPGNVRELENVIGHVCIMVMGSVIDIGDLPEFIRGKHGPFPVGDQPPSVELGSLEEHERRLLTEALAKVNGNQSGAARLLRISRDTLRYRIKKHGLSS